MSVKHWLQFAAVALGALFIVCVLAAWRSARRQQVQLEQQLKSAQQALQQADARQQARDQAVQQIVGQLQKQQAAVQKPADVLKALPSVLPLPAPLVLDQSAQTSSTSHAAGQTNAETPAPKVDLPIQDLKPLYDAAIQCKECQAELSAAQADLKDEQTKTQALSRERDDALRAVKGGSVLRRVARFAKWFAIGAAAGALTARAAR
ncbi:MAG: hypothetical protein WBR26_03190 [Candidatus Acidiferrum sp.]